MVKKLRDFYRNIRKDVYHELKNSEVTLEDIKLKITDKYKREVERLIEDKRKSALTKLKLDYLEQMNNPKEIEKISRTIKQDIKDYQETNQ
ncbi:hypothetical protein [Bacillus cereus group sp. RP43]|uniref:hypothetical protein n=1 Tax=Bacillus cereus group sp. RP43 TaxID=3040260 RepID=UPI003392903C